MTLKLRILKLLANLNFAIILLLIIAIMSTIGSIIEQEQSTEFYQQSYTTYLFGKITMGQIILVLGGDHVFKTWWFNLLLVIFGASLLSCTFLQQFATFSLSKYCYFYSNPSQFYKYPIKTKIINVTNGMLIWTIKTTYTLFHEKNILYGYKGLFGRIAPIIVHISMNLILIGSILGASTGFNAQEFIPKTEIFHIQNILSINIWNYVPQVPSRLNDFWITYKKKNAINQFYSDISILDNSGREIKRSTISVNHPLKYKALNYYQTDWNILGFRVQYNKNIYQLPLLSPSNTSKTLWFSWIPTNPNMLKEGISLVLNNLVGTQIVYDTNGKFLKNLDINDNFTLENTTKKLKILDLIEATGLQIKCDPGLPFIYFGFGTLMITSLLSYLSYFQIWILRQYNLLFLASETNRAKLALDKETINLLLNFTK